MLGQDGMELTTPVPEAIVITQSPSVKETDSLPESDHTAKTRNDDGATVETCSLSDNESVVTESDQPDDCINHGQSNEDEEALHAVVGHTWSDSKLIK